MVVDKLYVLHRRSQCNSKKIYKVYPYTIYYSRRIVYSIGVDLYTFRIAWGAPMMHYADKAYMALAVILRSIYYFKDINYSASPRKRKI